jgi:hypothetical protein
MSLMTASFVRRPDHRGLAGPGRVHRVPGGRGPLGAGESVRQPAAVAAGERRARRAIFESLWATHEALRLSEKTEALLRAALRNIKRYIRMRQMKPGEPLSPDTAGAVSRVGDDHHGRGSGRYPDV